MLPNSFTHHPWPAIVGGLGLAVVWCAVKKKRNDARIIFLCISYECIKRKKEKERKKKGCAYKKLLHPSIIVRIDAVFQHAKNEQAALNRAA